MPIPYEIILVLINLAMRECTPLTNSSTIDPETTDILPQTPSAIRFSLFQRLLSNTKTKRIPQKLSLQPIKHRIEHKDQQQTSAKSILKKAILIDPQPRIPDEKNTTFLMRGKMVSGLKKPIENQMASLLQGINQRIKRQLSKQEKGDQAQLSQKLMITQTKLFDGALFKNLKELRLKRLNQESEQRQLIKVQHLQKRRLMLKNETFRNKISLSQKGKKEQSNTAKTTVSAISNSLCPVLVIKKHQTDFIKGYIAYDEAGKHFLETNRNSMTKQYLKIAQKSKEITASSFLVIDCSTLTPIAGKNISQPIEIASISKVMTCYLCLLVCRKYNIDIYTHQLRVSEKAAQTPGTTAELQSGDILTVFDLLMALMLPSGNDASVAIAEGMGKVIQRYKTKETKKSYSQIFVANMNLLSKELQLDQTWNNSSGLSINPNFSTPEAIAILTSIAVKDQTFNKIVNTKVYQLLVNNEKYGLSRKLTWRNTNKLLDSGWQGVKTGTTQNAGHCLMARKGNILVSVFNCESLSRRFTECVRLYQRFILTSHS